MGRSGFLITAVVLVLSSASTGCRTADDPKSSGVSGKAIESPERAVTPSPEVQPSSTTTPEAAAAAGEAGQAAGVADASAADGDVPTTATELCAYILDADEDTEIHECEFLAGGQDLGNDRRFELLRVRYTEGGVDELDQIYAVMRSADEVHSEILAESSEVPGESVEGTVGKVKRVGGQLIVPSQEKVTTFPNTGDPEADADEQVDIAKFTTTCVIEDLMCERESVGD